MASTHVAGFKGPSGSRLSPNGGHSHLAGSNVGLKATRIQLKAQDFEEYEGRKLFLMQHREECFAGKVLRQKEGFKRDVDTKIKVCQQRATEWINDERRRLEQEERARQEEEQRKADHKLRLESALARIREIEAKEESYKP